MPQIRFNKVSLQFSERPLLDEVSFSVEKGDRIAVIGRNGAGKSTLLKMIHGDIQPDSGQVEFEQHLKIAYMSQHPPEITAQTVKSYITAHAKTMNEWDQHPIDRVISLVNLDPDQTLDMLSGGQLRRLSLAGVLVNEPDVLLLDEPTNHLDIASIEWLEHFLLKLNITLILITHDRQFMQRIASQIWEIDLATIISWKGKYYDFLKHRETVLRTQENERRLFDKKLAQEEAWIRQGIKARRTRNEGRVRALKKMRDAYAERLNRQGTMAVKQQKSDYAGKLMFEIDNVSYDFDEHTIIKNFSDRIMRSDRIGIIGPNGCGKTTLINLLLGQIKPTRGTVKSGSQLKAAYFDQHRQQLNPDATAIDNVADGASHVTINGEDKHVISYLQDFLFSPDKARSMVRTFSGGERNRLLLAKILAQPTNLLVLDEPTNDLDMETLEFLEEYLLKFDGTLLLVSHDRSFIDNVVTSTLVFSKDGTIDTYVGGYDDYLRQHKQLNADRKNADDTKSKKAKSNKNNKKLSYKDQRELDLLPSKIEELELKIEQLNETMSNPDFFQQDKESISTTQKLASELQHDLTYAYDRWDILEKLKNQVE